MKISDFGVKHPAIIIILLAGLILFGLLAVTNLRQDLFSDIGMPSLLIITSYPGAAPQDIERNVTDILEEELTRLSGLRNMRSSSVDSISMITLEFEWDQNLDIRITDVREKINIASRRLPDGISGPPEIHQMSAEALPIYTVVVESPMETEELTRFTRNHILPYINRITGVSQVNLSGTAAKEAVIELDLQQLELRNIGIMDVYQALSYQNVSLPAGAAVYRDHRLTVRTLGEFTNLDDIRNVVVAQRNNTLIRIRDIADVKFRLEKPGMYSIMDNRDVVVIDVLKQNQADSVTIINELEDILAQIEQSDEGQVRFTMVADQSRDITLGIEAVRSAAFTGALLAVIVLLIFLQNVRTTIIIGISIPLSVLIAFIALYLRGQSLNLITLAGMTLAIGMMVDASIVVLENIHRHYQRGMPAKQAASLGAGEMVGAITASTSTSLAVFIPLLFIDGIAGIVLEDVSLTIVYALAGALLVAVMVIPFLAAYILPRQKQSSIKSLSAADQNNNDNNGDDEPAALRRLLQKKASLPGIFIFKKVGTLLGQGIDFLTTQYKKALQAALTYRKFVVLCAFVLLVISLITIDFLGFEFIPASDMNEFQMIMEMPYGYTLTQAKQKAVEVDKLLTELVPEREAALYYIGQESAWATNPKPNAAFGRVRISEVAERERSVIEIIDILRREIPARISDVDVSVVNGGIDALIAVAMGGEGFMIEVYGSDLTDILAGADQVREILNNDPQVVRSDIDISYNRQEMLSLLNLELMSNLGVSPYEAAMTNRLVFHGMEAGSIRYNEVDYDIFMTTPLADNPIHDDILAQLSFVSPEGALISFASFSDMEIRPALSGINRNNRMNSVRVSAFLQEPDVRAISERTRKALHENPLPAGVHWEIAGTTAEMEASFASLLFALAISIFLVYSVMVIQFERFVQPLIVMAAVPFTIIGVVVSLLIFNTTLNIVSMLGVIALGGIVVNNAIVLIDYINLLRQRDKLDLLEAVLAGAGSRLKPILMTTITTVLGVMPMALGIGEGTAIYAPLGQAIAGGLLTSTLITLFLIPVIYYITEKRILHLARAIDKDGTEKATLFSLGNNTSNNIVLDKNYDE